MPSTRPPPGSGRRAELALEGAVEGRFRVVAQVAGDTGDRRALRSQPLRGDQHPLFHIISMLAIPLIYSVYTGVAEAARDLALAHASPRRVDGTLLQGSAPWKTSWQTRGWRLQT